MGVDSVAAVANVVSPLPSEQNPQREFENPSVAETLQE
jgi:hypothetical protein